MDTFPGKGELRLHPYYWIITPLRTGTHHRRRAEGLQATQSGRRTTIATNVPAPVLRPVLRPVLGPSASTAAARREFPAPKRPPLPAATATLAACGPPRIASSGEESRPRAISLRHRE